MPHPKSGMAAMSDDARMMVAASFTLLFVAVMWWLRGVPDPLVMAIKPLATGASLGALVYWLLGKLPAASKEDAG